MGDECEECMQAMPMTHYHYEEYEPEVETTHVASKTWEDFLAGATRKVQEKAEAETKPAEKVSKRHTEARLDGSDWVCDACGSVSADFDLFEEVGAEVDCKSVEEQVAVEEVPQKEARITRKPFTPRKTEMSEEVMDMYRKMLDEITKERKREKFELPSWPKVGEVYTGRSSRIVEVEETIKHKSFADLAREHRAAMEDPENQKKWYSDVNAEIQRRERRR